MASSVGDATDFVQPSGADRAQSELMLFDQSSKPECEPTPFKQPSNTHFEHTPLDQQSRQIRLIYVPFMNRRLVDGEDLQCQLRTVDLDKYRFVALSYTWGPLDNSKTISINGKSFSVSENLWWCLNHISVRERLPTNQGAPAPFEFRPMLTRWFWIDQICIDQAKTSERNHQVKLMSQIYTRAERVLIWLGRRASASASVASIPTDKGYDGHLRQFTDEIAKISYWNRLWIVQEVILANEITVLYGPAGHEWQYVRAILRGDVSLKYSALLSRKAIPSINRNKFALHRALELFANHECEDSRDKVYGLMGIVHETQRIEIDYNKTAVEVFWDSIAAFRTKELKEPERIIELGQSMGVTGREEACGGQALKNFQLLFDGKNPALAFQSGYADSTGHREAKSPGEGNT